MDLIYTSPKGEDIGVLMDYEFDLAFGADENDFECKVSKESHVCEAGGFLYIEGTEYGGIIDAVESDTASNSIIYTGRTWHGILDSKILLSQGEGEPLSFHGDANAIMADILEDTGLSALFSASLDASVINVQGYAVEGYIGVYNGLRAMLGDAGGKLRLAYNDGTVVLSAAPASDYTKQDGIDSDLLDFKVKHTCPNGKVNHLVCIAKEKKTEAEGQEGQEEQAEQEEVIIVHLYADEEGNISDTQSKTGIEEYVSVFETSGKEVEKLVEDGTKRFKELLDQDSVEAILSGTNDAYDVGDRVTATDNLTGVTATVTIGKKIVSIRNGIVTISVNAEKAK